MIDFSVHPVGMDFAMFDTPHLVVLALVALANLALLPLRGSNNPRVRMAVRLGLAISILAAFVSYTAWRITSGLWSPRTDLPLHLCDVMAFVTAAMLLTQHRPLYDFVYFLGIGGATQALLTSDVGIYGYPHLYFISSMVAHGAIVTAGVHCAVVDGYRPTASSIRRVVLCGLAYTAVIFGVNQWLGSNYLFIGHKPEFPSLIDWLGPWPWYVLSLIAIGLLLVFALYAPFAWFESRDDANG